MKKAMMVVSIISLSFLLSDLSFAKKKKHRVANNGSITKDGVLQATGKAADDITKGAVNTTGSILKSL
jgi:hypothetical protein